LNYATVAATPKTDEKTSKMVCDLTEIALDPQGWGARVRRTIFGIRLSATFSGKPERVGYSLLLRPVGAGSRAPTRYDDLPSLATAAYKCAM